MELFHHNGHLTDEALSALVRGDPLPELARLEAAEHLSYCDDCLQRYTDALSGETLLVPAVSCEAGLWRRIRQRTLRLVTSRYATAVAGVALMVAVLWGVGAAGPAKPPELPVELPAISERLQSWPQRWSASLEGIFSELNGFFDQLGGTDRGQQRGANS